MRLAFVVQRYGLDINGGSEFYCRQLAERLSKRMHVEVLTTCAEDHYTWRNVYPEGPDQINNVLVRRFLVDQERDIDTFNYQSAELLGRPHTYFDEMRWMEMQGPVSSDLLRFLDLRQRQYDLFVFMTYMYASTFLGLQVVPQKSIMLPTAHDEPWLRFGIFRSFFHLPKAFIYLTPEEQILVHRLFRNEYIPSQVLSGVDAQRLSAIAADRPTDIFENEERISPDDAYIVFVGRVDPSKGCDELFDYFLRYKAETDSTVKLVLIGKPTMQIPETPDIVPLGFLHDAPYSWIARAQVLVLPSVWESLSLVVLEALGLGVPVLVNGHCDVLRGHCRRSNGGFYYYDYEEFAAALTLLLSQPRLRQTLGQQGQKYVQQNYAWEVQERRFVDWLTGLLKIDGHYSKNLYQ